MLLSNFLVYYIKFPPVSQLPFLANYHKQKFLAKNLHLFSAYKVVMQMRNLLPGISAAVGN